MAKKSVSRSPKSTSFDAMPLLRLAAGLALVFMGARKMVGYPADLPFGFLLLIVAGFLIYYTFPEEGPVMEWEEAPAKAVKKTSKKTFGSGKTVGWPLYLILVLAGLAVYVLYDSHFILAAIFVALIFGLILFFDLRTGSRVGPEASFDYSEEKWFWVMIVFALALRFAFMKTFYTGLQNDEGNNLTDTLAIMTNHTSPFVTAWGGTPVLPYYWYVFLFKIFGSKIWVARMGSAIMSVGAIYFFYKWTRLWLSPLACLIGSFWLAVSWWFFFFSLSDRKSVV